MSERRQKARYRVDRPHFVLACLRDADRQGPWRPVLIADESYSGCNVIIIPPSPDDIEVGDVLRLQFDTEDFSDATVVRVTPLTRRALSLGCQFE